MRFAFHQPQRSSGVCLKRRIKRYKALGTSASTSLLSAFQVGNRRPVQDAAERIEPRTVTGAVPCFFAAVPMHDTFQMWTYGGEFVERSFFIPICGNFSHAVAKQRAFAVFDFFRRRLVTSGQVIPK